VLVDLVLMDLVLVMSAHGSTLRAGAAASPGPAAVGSLSVSGCR
jgi:hypothetical protein